MASARRYERPTPYDDFVARLARLDILVPEVGLQRPRVVTIVRKLERTRAATCAGAP